MLQDAHPSYDSPRTHRRAVVSAMFLLITVTILISCNGRQTTRRVTQPYLADNITNPDEPTDNPYDSRESPQAQNGSAGASGPTAPDDGVDDFSAALDDYLNDPAAAKSKINSQSSMNSPAPQSDSSTNTTDRNEPVAAPSDAQPPTVQWDTPSRQPNINNATPADRKENIGAAKDPLRNNAAAVTEAAPAAVKHAGTTPDPADQSANKTDTRQSDRSPADTVKSFTRDELLVLLSAKLRREAAYSSVPLREYLLDSATLIIDPTRRISPDELYDLNSRERKLLNSMQGFFIEIGKQLETTRDPEIIIDAVSKLARGLGSDDRIEIPNFKLCTAVQSFGNYDEIESTTFIRGKPHEVITYIEVANFKSLVVKGGHYKTVLTQESELYTDYDGTLVFRQPTVTADDYCRNVRRDFFLVRHLTLPANLSVGSYYLKVRVKDETTQQQAEAVIPITIVAS